jgi:hypothetical protein
MSTLCTYRLGILGTSGNLYDRVTLNGYKVAR